MVRPGPIKYKTAESERAMIAHSCCTKARVIGASPANTNFGSSSFGIISSTAVISRIGQLELKYVFIEFHRVSAWVTAGPLDGKRFLCFDSLELREFVRL